MVPKKCEIPLTFTFKIEDPPKPAFLHLHDDKVIRVDTVREFTDSIEYTVGRHTRRISSDSVTDINACARVSLMHFAQRRQLYPERRPFVLSRHPLATNPSKPAPVLLPRLPGMRRNIAVNSYMKIAMKPFAPTCCGAYWW